jgi:hypothetical protein
MHNHQGKRRALKDCVMVLALAALPPLVGIAGCSSRTEPNVTAPAASARQTDTSSGLVFHFVREDGQEEQCLRREDFELITSTGSNFPKEHVMLMVTLSAVGRQRIKAATAHPDEPSHLYVITTFDEQPIHARIVLRTPLVDMIGVCCDSQYNCESLREQILAWFDDGSGN